MLNTNNTVNYETNIKQKEKKYSWSTVFSWLYLKTIGRILPKKWNKWAENILYYNKATGSDEIRTDKTTDESAQIDLKPEVTVKESQSEIVSEDEKVQTNKDEATFQDTTMQTECVETTDKNIGADLKPEVAEKGSQSEVISKNETTFQDTTMQTKYVETTDRNFQASLESEKEKALEDKNEELKEQLEDVSQALKAFIRLCDDQAQQIADLQLGDDFLEEENKELRSKLAELERNYRELAEVAKKRGEEFLAKLEEKSKEILKLNKELIERSTEFANKTEKLSVDAEEKDMKISSLMRLNEGLDEDKKKMEAEVENLKKQLQSAQESKQQLEKERIDLESKLKDLSSQLSAAEVEKKSSESEVSKLQKQVQILEESKEWELAGIGDTLNKTSLSVMELLAQQLPLNNQEQQLEHLNAELERVRSVAMSSIQAHSETLDENLTLKNQQIESSTAKDEQQNGKLTEDIQGQTKTKASDTVSCMGTVSKTTNRIKGIPNSLINSSVSVQQSGKIRFSLSYRDLEEMISIRGAKVDHATLQRDKSAALAFFRKAFRENDLPEKVVIDKSGSNTAALDDLNREISEDRRIMVFQIKYLNNIVEQDHRFIKKRIRPMLGFKSFHSAKITITGIENIRMIQKRQIIGANDNVSTFENFAMLIAL
ncbi:transposase [Trichonephila clavata]|uniref:Transposase n=1 Tax=Trichonephila clavata TaxID=2740835 RepID=A0A8X6FCQ1_TRICU|nr:transposase [Trichonephila clavata]